MSTPHITDLRQELLATLRDLRNRDNPMEPDRARAIASVAGVLVDSAKVEVEFLRATDGDRSTFLETPSMVQISGPGEAGNGINSVTRHALKN